MDSRKQKGRNTPLYVWAGCLYNCSMHAFILWAVVIGAALPAAASEAPAKFEAMDASAAINLKRGMTKSVFGPMLHETEESAFSNEGILALRVIVSVTKPEARCEDSAEPRCKTVTAYVETENMYQPEFSFRTKPAFGWTVETVDEYPKDQLPHCILVRLREEIREKGRDTATGLWPTQRMAACIKDIGQRHTGEFYADIAQLTEPERVVARQGPVMMAKQPDSPWSVGFITRGPERDDCKDTSLLAACKSLVVGMVSDEQGRDFAFHTPPGFAQKPVDVRVVKGEGAIPSCLAITFEEQTRSEEQMKEGGGKVVWPTRRLSTCVSPGGFAREE